MAEPACHSLALATAAHWCGHRCGGCCGGCCGDCCFSRFSRRRRRRCCCCEPVSLRARMRSHRLVVSQGEPEAHITRLSLVRRTLEHVHLGDVRRQAKGGAHRRRHRHLGHDRRGAGEVGRWDGWKHGIGRAPTVHFGLLRREHGLLPRPWVAPRAAHTVEPDRVNSAKLLADDCDGGATIDRPTGRIRAVHGRRNFVLGDGTTTTGWHQCSQQQQQQPRAAWELSGWRSPIPRALAAGRTRMFAAVQQLAASYGGLSIFRSSPARGGRAEVRRHLRFQRGEALSPLARPQRAPGLRADGVTSFLRRAHDTQRQTSSPCNRHVTALTKTPEIERLFAMGASWCERQGAWVLLGHVRRYYALLADLSYGDLVLPRLISGGSLFVRCASRWLARQTCAAVQGVSRQCCSRACRCCC